MTDTQNLSVTKTPTARAGMNLGWKAGLILSLLYVIIGIFIIESLGYGVGFSSLKFYDSFPWGDFFAMIFAVIIMILLLAIAPATIIGALTGTYLGILAETTRGRISKYLFVLLCIASCLVVVILIHLLFQIHTTLSFQTSNSDYLSMGIYESYPMYMGIPSVIYILTGGWIGWKLYSKAYPLDGLV